MQDAKVVYFFQIFFFFSVFFYLRFCSLPPSPLGISLTFLLCLPAPSCQVTAGYRALTLNPRDARGGRPLSCVPLKVGQTSSLLEVIRLLRQIASAADLFFLVARMQFSIFMTVCFVREVMGGVDSILILTWNMSFRFRS